MAYKSNTFAVTATTTAQTINLPTQTSSVLLMGLSTNTDVINVSFGSGSPIRVRAGTSIALSIEEMLQLLGLAGINPNPSLFMSSCTVSAVSGSQTLDIVAHEWRAS